MNKLLFATLAILATLVASQGPSICKTDFKKLRKMGKSVIRTAVPRLLENFLDNLPDKMPGKMPEMEKKVGCMEVKPGPKCKVMTKNGMECVMIEHLGPMIRAITKGDFPTQEEKQKAWLETNRCFLQYSEFDLIDTDGRLNFNNLRETMSEPAEAGTGKDALAIQKMFIDCIDEQKTNEQENRKPGEVSLAEIRQCFFGGVIETCNAVDRDEDIGKKFEFVNMINSMHLDGKCQGVGIPKQYGDAWEKCCDMTSLEIEQEIADAFIDITEIGKSGKSAITEDGRLIGPLRAFFKSMKMGNSMDHMKGKLIGFLSSQRKMVQKGGGTPLERFLMLVKANFEVYLKPKLSKYMMMTTKCVFNELGWMDSDGKTYLGNRYVDYFKTKLTGWEGAMKGKRDEILTAQGECYADFMPSLTLDMDDMIKSPAKVEEMMRIQRNCFMPKYIKICGMNNELTRWYLPYHGEKEMERMHKKVSDKMEKICNEIQTGIKEMCPMEDDN